MYENCRGGHNDDFRPLTYTLWGGEGMWCRDKYVTYVTLWIHTSGGGDSDIRSMSSIRPICQCRCPQFLRAMDNLIVKMTKFPKKICLKTGQFLRAMDNLRVKMTKCRKKICLKTGQFLRAMSNIIVKMTKCCKKYV
jgi:3-deoxy-D-manno-octulosonic acid (KDO) 8-phosphate synthase